MLKQILLFFIGSLFFSSCSSPEQSQDKMIDFQKVKYDPAYTLKEISAAINRDPHNATHYFKRAQFYVEANNYTAALKDINQAIAQDEEKGEYYFRKAQILRKTGNYAAALTAATRAEDLNFRSTDLDVLLGELYLFSKKYGMALQYLNDAAEETPQNEYIYFYRGLAYAQTRDTMAAIRNFKSAIRRSPDLVEAYNQLVKIYFARKEDALALDYLRAGQKQDSANAYLWFYRGEYYNNLKQVDSAYISYRNAIKYDSLLYLARQRLGILAFNKNKYSEAAAEIEKALKHSDNLPQAHLVLGESYERTGKLEQALAHYQWIYKREPENIKAMWGVRRTMYQLYKIKRDSLRQDEKERRDSLLAIFRARRQAQAENKKIQKIKND
ncbi:tetratricopeptide repeat protein [Adhaeribacter radiodurans]|uniref:Tetratricopeptide repeat protein n=1 Tax=Adhaeribacter radiodurans TaxID=2745197 RepID=A0A7L7L6E2_9BACT|nr:tetratricopeptide repeat protein [Adhaeribacter radiodurans]QMU28402.1 tetratricopeptide repeat protein [Adhaeribacter radiodurans]